MPHEIYRKLAQRLDTIPNGFPATESGVELRLLEKMFTPEEAALAVVMRLTAEPAADIAARAGVNPKIAGRMLKDMVRKGQIRAKIQDGHLLFRLLPFVVGSYEEQLPRMDAELAALFEAYLQETQGADYVSGSPAVHRVVPVGETISVDIEAFPYERAVELVEGAKSWGVRDCICRVQQKLIGKGCDRPIEVCLVFAPAEGAFKDSSVDRPIPKEEALQILRQAEEAGLVHTTGNYRDGHSYICNCCACCCGILRSVTEFGVPGSAIRSDFRPVVDTDACIGCGECVDLCQFGALSIPEDICQVDDTRCIGCGLCATACSVDALHLTRRPEGEVAPPPRDRKEWMMQRAQARGVRIQDIL
jgi:Pyruvate/2-oxoacid:ferredoxin oxidoreductase delta subunit